MPIYEYQSVGDGCEYCSARFDRLQKISDAPLESCPHCEGKVERLISAPNLGNSGPSLSPDNIEKHGFTQYKKSGDGVYEKTAGKGPRTIHRDQAD